MKTSQEPSPAPLTPHPCGIKFPISCSWTGLVALLIAAIVGGGYVIRRLVLALNDTGPEYRFALPEPPAFLPDALALEKARTAMVAAGYTVDEWVAEEISTTRAPDGTLDIVLCRSNLDSKCGFIQFHSKADFAKGIWTPLIVDIEVRGGSVVCWVYRGH